MQICRGRNIKLTIEYDGTGYAGWQRQNSRRSRVSKIRKKTVQETIENVLDKLFREKPVLIGAGRTDAGVHAFAQTANFRLKHKIDLGRLQKALNSNLPKDIVITGIEEAGPDFHSRFDASSKIYRYSILNRHYSSAFLKDRIYFYPHALNVGLMRNGAKFLVGRYDFKSFCGKGGRLKSSVRTIKRIDIKKQAVSAGSLNGGCAIPYNKASIIDFIIEADGFLYNMARNVVGTLLEAGRGKIRPADIKSILRAKNRDKAGPTMPAEGLCLMRVKY